MGVYGKLKLVYNTSPRMGSAVYYWFLKVYSGPREDQEEHWLVTPSEAERFVKRGGFITDADGGSPFLAEEVERRRTRLGKIEPLSSEEDLGYGSVTVEVRYPDRRLARWEITPHELAEIRRRAELNREDIVRNRESWLVDLFD